MQQASLMPLFFCAESEGTAGWSQADKIKKLHGQLSCPVKLVGWPGSADGYSLALCCLQVLYGRIG